MRASVAYFFMALCAQRITAVSSQSSLPANVQVVASDSTSGMVRDMANNMEARSIKDVKPVDLLRHGMPLPALGTDFQAAADEAVDIGFPSSAADSSSNTTTTGEGIPNPSVSFEGISQVDHQRATGFAFLPPDTVGDVGPNHYMQAVNLAVAIYDKKGKILMPVMPLATIWEGFAVTDCADPLSPSDPIVTACIVDPNPTACYTCVAISTDGDPTGAYYRYAFRAQQDPADPARTVLPDYPKMSVWSDSYILTTRDFDFDNSYFGTSVYAFEKAKMIAGDPNPGVLRRSLDFAIYGALIGDELTMLPADIDGDNLPPPGSPVPILSVQDDLFGDASFDALNVWELSVDWSQNTGSLNFKESLPVAPFTTYFYGIP